MPTGEGPAEKPVDHFLGGGHCQSATPVAIASKTIIALGSGCHFLRLGGKRISNSGNIPAMRGRSPLWYAPEGYGRRTLVHRVRLYASRCHVLQPLTASLLGLARHWHFWATSQAATVSSRYMLVRYIGGVVPFFAVSRRPGFCIAPGRCSFPNRGSASILRRARAPQR